MSEKVSVIIPTLNREDFLIPALNDLLKQSYKNFEIIVVDQSEVPSVKVLTLAQVHAGRIAYHHVRFRGLPIARNFGWQKAQGNIVIYLDDDIRCGPELVSQHVESMKDPSVGVVAGGIEEPNRNEDPNPSKTGVFSFWTATPHAGFQSKNPQQVQHAKGANFSVRKKLFGEVGGFDEVFSRGAALYEELDFCLRVFLKGDKIIFNPDARLIHLVAETGGCRVPQLARYLQSMSRNRMMIILRYLNWYHRPVAILRLILLNLSYVRSQREPSALISGMNGFFEGLREAKNLPLTTKFE